VLHSADRGAKRYDADLGNAEKTEGKSKMKNPQELDRHAETAADDVIKRLQWMSADRRLFPRVDKGDRLDWPDPRMLGIRRLSSGGGVNLFVLREKWKLLVRPRHLGPRVLRILERRGVLLPGKEPGRHVVQRQVQGLGSRRSFLEFDGKELARFAARLDAPRTDNRKDIWIIFDNERGRALRERAPIRSAAK
jgi:hypothetical protein